MDRAAGLDAYQNAANGHHMRQDAVQKSQNRTSLGHAGGKVKGGSVVRVQGSRVQWREDRRQEAGDGERRPLGMATPPWLGGVALAGLCPFGAGFAPGSAGRRGARQVARGAQPRVITPPAPPRGGVDMMRNLQCLWVVLVGSCGENGVGKQRRIKGSGLCYGARRGAEEGANGGAA